MTRRAARGFTVIELMAVVAVSAVLLALAVPAFLDLLARRRLEGAAGELHVDLQLARSEAVSRQLDVALRTAGDGRSYDITAAGTPTPVLIKEVTLPGGVTVTGDATLTYTALRGLPSETSAADRSITVSSSDTAGRLRVENNAAGRTRLCSPEGSVKGYAPC